MGLDEILHGLGDKVARWDDYATTSRFRRRVQIRTLADLAAIGEELGGKFGQVAYLVAGHVKTIEQISDMTALQLHSLVILVYPPGVQVGEYEHSKAFLEISNADIQVAGQRRAFMMIKVPEPSAMDHHPVPLSEAKRVALRSVKVRGWWRLGRNYPVVNTITKATEDQRSHDRRIRWQAAGISLGVSVLAAVVAAFAKSFFGA